MPRPVLNVWSEFLTEFGEDGKKKVKATCKHCGKSWKFPNATRLSTHLPSCTLCPEGVKETYRVAKGSHSVIIQEEEDVENEGATGSSDQRASKRPSSTDSSTTQILSTSGGGDSHGVPTAAKKQCSSLSTFLDHITPEAKEKIDRALARAVYANGLPLSVLESKHFQKAFTLMRPAYGKPPSRYKLGGPLLDAEFATVSANNKVTIESSDCCAVMSDGCASVNREHVINFIVTTPKPILYTYKVMGKQRETAQVVARELREVIVEIGINRCYLLVADNAPVMQAAMEILTLEFPHLTAVGCASHCWNLLFKDIMSVSTLSKLFKVAKVIVKSVKNVYVNLAAFRNKQQDKYGTNAVSLKLPASTRWGGAVITFNSLMRNKAAIQETVVNEDLTFTESVRRWALDNNKFWERVKFAIDMLKPLHACITIIESNRALLSDVFYLQKKYSQAVTDNLGSLPFKNREKNAIMRYLQDRENFTVKTIHKVCFLLDPRFRDKHDLLNADDIVDIIDFLGLLCTNMGLDEGAVIASLGHFRAQTGLFSRESIWSAAERMAPSVWWSGVCGTEALAPLARRILSLPPSAAECERNWKLRKFIHSKSRNRLKNERVRKLVSVQTALKEPNQKASDANRPFFTVAEIESYFETYLPAASGMRIRIEREEGEEDSDVDFEEDDSENDDYEDEDFNISDWSDGDDEDEGEGERQQDENVVENAAGLVNVEQHREREVREENTVQLRPRRSNRRR